MGMTGLYLPLSLSPGEEQVTCAFLGVRTEGLEIRDAVLPR